MTFSIVARDPGTGHLGIAVASRFFAVGAVVPWIRPGAGAIATQAFINMLYGVDGLDLLERGLDLEVVADELMRPDQGREHRQFHVLDARGRAIARTGRDCVQWCGHLVGDQVSVAGNMLAGPQVIEAMMVTYAAARGEPFAERLLLAMEAGEAAGGDARGRQSAALKIHRDDPYPWLDIRADDDADPLRELRRLHAVARERYLHFVETIPTRANPSGNLDRRDLDRAIGEAEALRRQRGEPSASRQSLPGPRADSPRHRGCG